MHRQSGSRSGCAALRRRHGRIGHVLGTRQLQREDGECRTTALTELFFTSFRHKEGGCVSFCTTGNLSAYENCCRSTGFASQSFGVSGWEDSANPSWSGGAHAHRRELKESMHERTRAFCSHKEPASQGVYNCSIGVTGVMGRVCSTCC